MKTLYTVILLPIITACSFTATVNIENDATPPDASNDVVQEATQDVLDAGTLDVVSPNAWVYDQPNFSLKLANCEKIIGDASTPYIETMYNYNGGVYKSAIPFYICSNNLSDNCNVEQQIITNNVYYKTPTPNSLSGNVPNTITSNCTISYTQENTAIGPGVVYDWYVLGLPPTQVITDCMADGGTLYTMMVLLYDDNFQATIDKNSSANMQFFCN